MNMSIYISELLPNPAGKDVGNEWIEICNNGSQPQSLAGWKLQDASVKSFTIQNIFVAPQSCVVFGNTETKISLNNDKETVSLFDMSGNLVDRASYTTVVKDDQALVWDTSIKNLQLTTTPTKGEIRNIIAASPARTTKNTKLNTENKITTTIPTTVDVGTPAYRQAGRLEASGQIQTLTPGMSIGEVVLIGACVVGILTVIFMKVVMQLKPKTEGF